MCCNDLQKTELPRRHFLGLAAGAVAAGPLGAARLVASPRSGSGTGPDGTADAIWAPDGWSPERPFLPLGKELRVQPVLLHAVATRREAASWKSWGGVQSDAAAAAEAERIAGELATLAASADFSLEILPVARARTPEEARRALASPRDVTIVYPATGSGDLLRAAVPAEGPSLIFVRRRSGPIYYWYEALSTRYLGRSGTGSFRASAGGDAPLLPAVTVDDVVVDDPAELLWRLRALRGALSLPGTRVVALGGPWGKYAPEAPERARSAFGLEIVDVTYESLEPRIAAALASAARRARVAAWTAEYLSLPGTELRTERSFVENAFILYGLFKELLAENGAETFTIKDCMRTIMPMSRTTACLTLGLLNDEGLLAFCESDFVVIPAGILLRYIAGRPVFLHNSTFPHHVAGKGGMVTCAHCAAPRRMDARRYEPAKILTHYESEFGAAPKVEIPPGQEVTFVDPEYATGRWVGFRGRVDSNPFYEICRSQQDVVIQGEWRRLLDEARDSHWLMVYGDCLAEAGYAARKLGIRWEEIPPG